MACAKILGICFRYTISVIWINKVVELWDFCIGETSSGLLTDLYMKESRLLSSVTLQQFANQIPGTQKISHFRESNKKQPVNSGKSIHFLIYQRDKMTLRKVFAHPFRTREIQIERQYIKPVKCWKYL